MTENTVLELTTHAMVLVLVLSMPPIIVATVTGILVSLVQALTQVQEQTLSFAVKLISVTITLALTATWLGGEILLFTRNIFDMIGKLIH
jgi:type III secretion protein S